LVALVWPPEFDSIVEPQQMKASVVPLQSWFTPPVVQLFWHELREIFLPEDIGVPYPQCYCELEITDYKIP